MHSVILFYWDFKGEINKIPSLILDFMFTLSFTELIKKGLYIYSQMGLLISDGLTF